MNDNCCNNRKKERSEEEYKKLLNRLNRIEGQIRGVKGMLEKDAYCVDIITQVSAIAAALNSFNRILLSEHIKTCVKNDIQTGKDNSAEELADLVNKLLQ
ncbi:MAG: metal-sensing transcriptional repressor [Coprococcus sp.]|nr:metal-sensing transcriptional repressor [Coprococcus sp.]